MTHDTVLVFSKTYGAIYLLVFFLIATAWVYWPRRRKTYEKAAEWPLQDEACRDD
ncbi:cbb3-type cytochrome c oxidase subunit 3 [uncultured Roseobacter sp.]|uniref:cbb3-type cytochrome c oxidase subunit 3 n=1 Tax=uncultured Roseobacter sp. TaxID=114847 RepID=UPI00262D6AD5|nr:cbb3-type cytochrome c oxidase subunit 3 [uncultured Roseobacter sp.]